MSITHDHERLLDLVRYKRHDLHMDGLIDNEEYAALVSVGSESARRLEGYDELRAQNAALVKALREMSLLRETTEAALGVIPYTRTPIGWEAVRDMHGFAAAFDRWEAALSALNAHDANPIENCTCHCCQEETNRRKHGRAHNESCSCRDYELSERCDCDYCSTILANAGESND